MSGLAGFDDHLDNYGDPNSGAETYAAEDNQADIRDKFIARYGRADHERLEQIVLLTVGVIDR